MTNTLVTTEDVAARLGRDLTNVERLRLDDVLDEMYEFLQGYLNRIFVATDYIDEKHDIPGEFNTVYPFYGPVNQIYYLRVGSLTAASTTAYNEGLAWQTFPGEQTVYVSYSAGGDAETQHCLTVVKNLIRRTALKYILQGDQQFTGLSSYSVEGVAASFNTTPNYHIKTADLFEGKDLEGLDRWVRPVIR